MQDLLMVSYLFKYWDRLLLRQIIYIITNVKDWPDALTSNPEKVLPSEIRKK